MPKYANSNPDAKLAYLNGHFGYYLKCSVSTNALGLVRNVNFYDSSLPMVYDGITPEKGRADRIKYICPKTKKTKINGKTSYFF